MLNERGDGGVNVDWVVQIKLQRREDLPFDLRRELSGRFLDLGQVDRIARAVNVTKPALYRAFGDKSTLLLRAVERYALIYGAPKMAAFQAEPDIHKAVTTFCEVTVYTATGDARSGCMLAAAALGHSERVTEIRSWLANGFTANAHVFAKRFEKEMKAGCLTRTPSAKVRGRLLVDLLQGVQLRAKVGITRKELLEDVRSYVPLILGK